VEPDATFPATAGDAMRTVARSASALVRVDEITVILL